MEAVRWPRHGRSRAAEGSLTPRNRRIPGANVTCRDSSTRRPADPRPRPEAARCGVCLRLRRAPRACASLFAGLVAVRLGPGGIMRSAIRWASWAVCLRCSAVAALWHRPMPSRWLLRDPTGNGGNFRRFGRTPPTGGNAVPPRTGHARLRGRSFWAAVGRYLVVLERGARSLEDRALPDVSRMPCSSFD